MSAETVPKRWTAHRARPVIAGVIAVAAVAGTRFAYGVVLAGLADHLDEAVGAAATGLMVHWLVFTVTAPLAWRAYVRLGARPMIAIGGVCCAVSIALLPFAQSALAALIVYGVVSGVGSHGLGQLATNQPVIAAIPPGADRDRAFGLIACGAPIGTATVPAIGALAIAGWGWAAGCAAIGAVIGTACVAAALVTLPSNRRAEDRPRRTYVPATGTRTVWLNGSFLLLSAGFALALFIQISVPFVLPVWSGLQGLGADQLAVAFVVLGGAGVLGRVLMTSRRLVLGTRLWIVVPAALIALLGFALAAVLPTTALVFYVVVVLLGFATPIIGALFAIASLACFPPELFARVGGTLLIPIGLGAAFSALLPGAIVDAGAPLWAIWSLLGGLTLVAAAAVLCAELVSPVFRSQRAPGRPEDVDAARLIDPDL